MKSENVELISLKIDKDFEGLGFDQKLLNFFCSQLRNLGYQSIELYYGSSWENLDRLEHLLVKGGWGDPLFFIRYYQIDAKKALAAFGEDLKLPKTYALESWSTISAKDKEGINNKYCQLPQLPIELSPFKISNLEPDLSLFMRYDGEIVGWIALSKISDETLEYNAIFLDPKHRVNKVAPSLIAEALRIQVKNGDYPKVLFSVRTSNRKMMQFLEINRQSSSIRTDVYRVIKTL